MSLVMTTRGLSHLFSQLIYDDEHFFSDIMSPILPMPITIFSLSTYCRMCKQFQTFGKMFGKAELFVDVHHPLADDVSGDDNSSGLSHLFSQLVSDYEHLFSDIFQLFCLCPLLSSLCLSIAGCADCLTLLARCSARPSSLLTFITT